MPSARLLAFHGELDAALPALQARAEALILRVPGEGQPAMTAEAEATVLTHVAEGIIPPVQAWVKAVQDLASAEKGWGPSEHARAAGARFVRATEDFLEVWQRLLLIQPATEPMRHVLGLIHLACYEFFLSGPVELRHVAGEIVAGKREATLTFEPSAPSLNQAAQELRRLKEQA